MFTQYAAKADVSWAPSAARTSEIGDLMKNANVGAITFYPINSVIYAQSESAGPLYYVEFGTVRVCRIINDGRRQITAFFFAGDVFGLEAGDEHECYAESVDGAGIRVLRPLPGSSTAPALLRLALRGLGKIQEHLVLLGRMSAAERMATFLLNLMDRQESDDVVCLQMQRTDVGDYLGLTFETVSRVLRTLKEKGMIRIPSADRVEIVDRDALAAMCV